MAERAFITRPTLAKVEEDTPGVSLGIYAMTSVRLSYAMGETFRGGPPAARTKEHCVDLS